MIELITAHKGRAHVTSEDEAARIRGMMGEDCQIISFHTGDEFYVSIEDVLRLTIGVGEGFVNGRFFRITEPIVFQLDEFEKANTYRRDTIALELLENAATGEEYAEFVVVKGEEHSTQSACVSNDLPSESTGEAKLIGCVSFFEMVFSSTTVYKTLPNINHIQGLCSVENDVFVLKQRTAITDDQVSNLQKSFRDGCKKIAKACTDKGVSTADNASPDTIATNIGKVFQKGKESFHTTYGGSGYEFDTNGTITIPVKYCSYFKITLNEIGASFCTIECGAMKKTLSKAGETYSFAPVDFNSSYLKIAAGGASGKVKGKYDVQYSI